MNSRGPTLPAIAFGAALLLAQAGPAPAAEPVDAANPAKVDADYAIQGEYQGDLENDKWGAQVVALGDGKFQVVGYPGGLPGAGWDGDRAGLVRGTGGTSDGKTAFSGKSPTDVPFNATWDKDGLHVFQDGRVELGTLKRIVRESPTLGAKPPAGAVVLFDGKSTDAWKEAKMTDEGLLIQGATSRQHFQSFSAHLEFRTPYRPKQSSQERGNSGFYAQGRYEVQVLDSFGLKGEKNECGAIYSIKAPDVNMCLPPLQWQTYDVDFTAASFDGAGKKTANARITVKHNGVTVHENVEVDHATTAAPVPEGPEPGPVYLQDHGNPVRYRNVWVVAK